ncbi:urease accessory protein [Helicobacter sp. 12S02634-8]|uniref:urease accessory protein UreD n=1 Tax=Helicobacter sp. 12S02634-8 TaxID=1476199 RepID=UPI000BA64125|nr:urease accessory protein UreD [Helicobacter sp. 12S02634-8]PAF46937.1 urease accessory protein [Helicobacter sp. 12S02634-8]
MTNYAQESKLTLKTKIGQNGKCIIEDSFFTPPLKLMAPFYDTDNKAEIMLISVSAGMMEGDRQELDLHIGKDCQVRLTSQSFEKIHDTQNGFASRNTQITLDTNAYFDFSPLPIIPFRNSHFKGATTICMHKTSQLLYGEIICAGRISREEIFAFDHFATTLKIYQDNKPIFFDNTILDPKESDLSNMCMFDGYTHYLNLIIIAPHISLESLKEMITSFGLNGGVSAISGGGLCLKALSNGSEALIKLREKISTLPILSD